MEFTTGINCNPCYCNIFIIVEYQNYVHFQLNMFYQNEWCMYMLVLDVYVHLIHKRVKYFEIMSYEEKN